MLTNEQVVEALLLPLTEEEKDTYRDLQDAFDCGIAGIMVCVEKDTGKRVVAVCAFIPEEGGTTFIMPLAKLFDGNPIDELVDPRGGDNGL